MNLSTSLKTLSNRCYINLCIHSHIHSSFHPSTELFTDQIPLCFPTNSIKAMKSTNEYVIANIAKTNGRATVVTSCRATVVMSCHGCHVVPCHGRHVVPRSSRRATVVTSCHGRHVVPRSSCHATVVVLATAG